ncbi:hypothetical protein PR048_002892, partial [Dryococelus australis]
MLACTWQDTGRVSMLSTVLSSEIVAINRRTKKSPTGFEKVEKQKLVSCYNKKHERSRQIRSTTIWYFLIEAALVNGRIVYNKTNNKTVGASEFRNAVIAGLLEHYVREPAAKRGRK